MTGSRPRRSLRRLDGAALPQRLEIAASWTRSRDLGVVPSDALSHIPSAEIDPGSRLMAAAAPVLQSLEQALAGTEFCTVLADRDCRVVYRWFDDPRTESIFDELGVRTGSMFLEECVGTNALGTALELRRGVAINGAEHFAEQLKPFSCYGQPIRNPLTNRVEGVLDFTALGDIANPLLSALVARSVDDIEQRLLDGTRASERHLLSAFQFASARRRHPIVALGDNVVLSNRLALDLLQSADFATLRALTGNGRGSAEFAMSLALTSGAEVLVRAVPVDGASGGTIFDITLMPEVPAVASPATSGPAADPRLPLLITGVAGTGRTRTALAAVTRQPSMVIEPGLALLEGEEAWAQQFAEAMNTRAGTVVIEGIDLLPERLVSLIINRTRDVARPHLVLTAGPVDSLGGLAHTLASMCVRSIDLLPLAQRAPAIGELAAKMLAEVSPGSSLRLSPSAIEALAAQRWVGNFHELKSVLTYVAARRSAGDVTVHDLPPAYQSAASVPQLGGLQRAERAAIIAALEEHGGNKLLAARALGVSRTTLYSRLRTLRIT